MNDKCSLDLLKANIASSLSIQNFKSSDLKPNSNIVKHKHQISCVFGDWNSQRTALFTTWNFIEKNFLAQFSEDEYFLSFHAFDFK